MAEEVTVPLAQGPAGRCEHQAGVVGVGAGEGTGAALFHGDHGRPRHPYFQAGGRPDEDVGLRFLDDGALDQGAISQGDGHQRVGAGLPAVLGEAGLHGQDTDQQQGDPLDHERDNYQPQRLGPMPAASRARDGPRLPRSLPLTVQPSPANQPRSSSRV